MVYLLDTNACIRCLNPPYDLQIAAIALASDLTLVTRNTAEFSRIRNLKLEDWET